MNLHGHHLDFSEALNTITHSQPNTIGIQLPEGLKTHTLAIQKYLHKHTTCTLIFIADPCYGACDLVDHKIAQLQTELILHIGHTPMPDQKKPKIPTIFIPTETRKNITKALLKILPVLEGNTIGITTTAQHLNSLETITQFLKKHNYISLIGNGDKRIDHPGQILGCNFTSATNIQNQVDSYLFLGSGSFHPLGLLMQTNKPVIALDPYTFEIQKEDLIQQKNTILRKRHSTISLAKTATTFGILIGLKPGQQRLKQALYLQQLIQKQKKTAILIALDYFTSTSLLSYSFIQCFVSTACPRIAIDDSALYKKPLLTPLELEIAFNIKKWDEYRLDEIYASY